MAHALGWCRVCGRQLPIQNAPPVRFPCPFCYATHVLPGVRRARPPVRVVEKENK